MNCEKCIWHRKKPIEGCRMRMDMDNAIYHCPYYEKVVLHKADVIKSVCEHENQERIDWGTNICKDCNRLISTIKQTVL